MSNKIFGYARVSTASQDSSLDEQRLRLLDEGCDEVFLEAKSGKSAANRPELQSMLAKLRQGDVVLATKIDRIARSTQDFLSIASQVEAAGACLRFLDQPIDTSDPAGKLLITMVASFAEFERSMIVDRVNAGLDRAKREGVTLGRPRKQLDSDPKVQGLLTLVSAGQTVTAAAKTVGVSRSTAKRWIAASA
jgi:DNA invertase Pin-like site-specific DNA recombinase